MKSKGAEMEVRLQRLLNLLSEDILSLSEEELDEGIRATGEDPKDVARAGRIALAKARATCSPNALAQARDRYDEEVSQLAKKNLALPDTFKAKLALAKSCLTRHQYLQPILLTGHYHRLSEVSEADLNSLLQQLHALGLLELQN